MEKSTPNKAKAPWCNDHPLGNTYVCPKIQSLILGQWLSRAEKTGNYIDELEDDK